MSFPAATIPYPVSDSRPDDSIVGMFKRQHDGIDKLPYYGKQSLVGSYYFIFTPPVNTG